MHPSPTNTPQSERAGAVSVTFTNGYTGSSSSTTIIEAAGFHSGVASDNKHVASATGRAQQSRRAARGGSKLVLISQASGHSESSLPQAVSWVSAVTAILTEVGDAASIPTLTWLPWGLHFTSARRVTAGIDAVQAQCLALAPDSVDPSTECTAHSRDPPESDCLPLARQGAALTVGAASLSWP